MRGLALALVVILVLAGTLAGIVAQPDESPLQFGQFCEMKKVSGQGIAIVNTSIEDDQISLVYESSLAGDGAVEMDEVHLYSQKAESLRRKVDALNQSSDSNLNLYETLKLTYSGPAPLTGKKLMVSSMGSVIEESFAVTEMEKDQVAFMSSTKDNSLESNQSTLCYNPAPVQGLYTRNAFDGLWSTDASWHKMLRKDIKAYAKFDGLFEAEKLIMFHKNAVNERTIPSCGGIDC
jgi:hypothetical protein